MQDEGADAQQKAHESARQPDKAVGNMSEGVQTLYRSFGPQLYRLAWAILRDSDLAADAVQEAFALLAQRTELFDEQRGHENIRGWLVRTVQFQAKNIRRKYGRGRQAIGEISDSFGDLAQDEDQLTRLENEEEVEQLRLAIDGLPGAQREVILRRLRDDQSFAEIANELEQPLGTVLSRMRLAMHKLRTRLKEQ